MPTPREVLVQNQRDALALVQNAGLARTREVLERAERELVERLALVRPGPGNFTYEQMRNALVQVRQVLFGLRAGMQESLVDGATAAADRAAQGTIDYMYMADGQFRGMGAQGLALDETAMFESARVGARSSVLHRLASSGTGVPGAPGEAHPAKPGILERYGVETIKAFEGELQQGLLQRKPWEEIKSALVAKSPFLQMKPRFWAERIVRTELMGAYNRAGWESTREADDQLGDMVKILSATFDDRTGADSFAVHGQVRRPEEAFQSWFGLYQHPPNRPNDREIVVPHRMSWPMPDYLRPKADGEVLARWLKEGRKGKPPPRPLMSTVDADFGAKPPPKVAEQRPDREQVPPEE